MAIERDPRGIGHMHSRAYDPGDPRAYLRPPSALQRFLGGSPFGVFVRLLLLSVLVGAGMALFGLTPGEIFWRSYDMVRVLIEHGLDTFHEFGNWILAGAMVVVPLWLLSRFLAFNRR